MFAWSQLLLDCSGMLLCGPLASWAVLWRKFLASVARILSSEISPSRKRYRLRPRSPLANVPPSTAPGVSILRPLKGLDTNLYENLESTFTQEYPNFEILLSVADES
ncbi:hypothetical protein GGX14DRAFT_421704, partial [Mycena pura]